MPSNSYVRQMGAKTIIVRGEEIHPECMTEEEGKLTVIFTREIPNKYCPRCTKHLSEVPNED